MSVRSQRPSGYPRQRVRVGWGTRDLFAGGVWMGQYLRDGENPVLALMVTECISVGYTLTLPESIFLK